MPRKSRAALAVAPVKNLGTLPAAPANLTEYQASIWDTVVATKPADWWDASNVPMLVSLCKHIATAEMLDQRIDVFEPRWLDSEEGMERLRKLTDMREKQTRAISSLSTKMRLTQQAKYDKQRALTAAKTGGPTRRPWESD